MKHNGGEKVDRGLGNGFSHEQTVDCTEVIKVGDRSVNLTISKMKMVVDNGGS